MATCQNALKNDAKKGKNPAILTAYGRRSKPNNKRNIFVNPKLYREDHEVPHQKKRTKTAISWKKNREHFYSFFKLILFLSFGSCNFATAILLAVG